MNEVVGGWSWMVLFHAVQFFIHCFTSIYEKLEFDCSVSSPVPYDFDYVTVFVKGKVGLF